jgi:hypothetical protein
MNKKEMIEKYNEMCDIIKSQLIDYINRTFKIVSIYMILKVNNDSTTKQAVKGSFESEYKKIITKINHIQNVTSCNLDDIIKYTKDAKADAVDLTLNTLKGELR